MEFFKKEDIHDIAQIKRFMELGSLIPNFAKEFESDPEGTFKKYNLDLAKEDVAFYPVKTPGILTPIFKDSKATLYADFMARKFERVGEIRDNCEPSNASMKKWRDRQINRCKMELGGKSNFLVHVPFTIEIADGCSVGCEFCGLNAGKLKSVFKYTEENARLFNGVLNAAKEIIGDAAGEGTMYFASEPLDNPDYEKFLADFISVFDRIPQITTAAVLRHTERMHKLLKQVIEDRRTIYRFSVLSEEIAWKILDEFTPEELLMVELLPQYSEAPSNGFVKAGRNASDEYDSTISCVSGFVVNMARKELRLTTPTNATGERPTGEYKIDMVNFENVSEFRTVLKGMISKHMMNIIKPGSKLVLKPYVEYKLETDKINITSPNGGLVALDISGQPKETCQYILELLKQGNYTKREIVKQIIDEENVIGVGSEYIFYLINKFWSLGLIEDLSGQV